MSALSDEIRAAVELANRPLLDRIAGLEALVRLVADTRADELLTVDASARLINVTPGSLRAKIKRGTLPVTRRGGSILIRRADLLGKVQP